MNEFDVLVVGSGNAAMCAALEHGGNTAFISGAIRVAYNTLDQLYELMPDLSDSEKRIPTSAFTPQINSSTTWRA